MSLADLYYPSNFIILGHFDLKVRSGFQKEGDKCLRIKRTFHFCFVANFAELKKGRKALEPPVPIEGPRHHVPQAEIRGPSFVGSRSPLEVRGTSSWNRTVHDFVISEQKGLKGPQESAISRSVTSYIV